MIPVANTHYRHKSLKQSSAVGMIINDVMGHFTSHKKILAGRIRFFVERPRHAPIFFLSCPGMTGESSLIHAPTQGATQRLNISCEFV